MIEFLGPLDANNNNLGRRLVSLFSDDAVSVPSKPWHVTVHEIHAHFKTPFGPFRLTDKFGGVFIESPANDGKVIEHVAQILSNAGFVRVAVDFAKFLSAPKPISTATLSELPRIVLEGEVISMLTSTQWQQLLVQDEANEFWYPKVDWIRTWLKNFGIYNPAHLGLIRTGHGQNWALAPLLQVGDEFFRANFENVKCEHCGKDCGPSASPDLVMTSKAAWEKVQKLGVRSCTHCGGTLNRRQTFWLAGLRKSASNSAVVSIVQDSGQTQKKQSFTLNPVKWIAQAIRRPNLQASEPSHTAEAPVHTASSRNRLFNVNQLKSIPKAEDYLSIYRGIRSTKGPLGENAAYWAMVPNHLVARCPICQAEYREAIDTNALSHWPPPLTGKEVFLAKGMRHCEHRLLVHRFINLNGVLIELGDPELLGKQTKLVAEVPHVIPLLLADEFNCKAVMHSLPICRVESGQFVPRYMLYMLTYFAPVGQHKAMLARIHAFQGGIGDFWSPLIQPFRVKVSDEQAVHWWDLTEWVEKGKLLWLRPDTEDLTLVSAREEAFPYTGITGRTVPYSISDPPWPIKVADS